MISCRLRILPSPSNTDNPRLSMALAAVLVGAVSERITFRRAVPPSAPLIPLSARIPSTVFISVTPPARFFAVPPTVRIASPSCATLVLDFCAVTASLSEKSAICDVSSPRADMASVTMSEAAASSIPPAAATLSTVGRAFTAFSASYPARAR